MISDWLNEWETKFKNTFGLTATNEVYRIVTYLDGSKHIRIPTDVDIDTFHDWVDMIKKLRMDHFELEDQVLNNLRSLDQNDIRIPLDVDEVENVHQEYLKIMKMVFDNPGSGIPEGINLNEICKLWCSTWREVALRLKMSDIDNWYKCVPVDFRKAKPPTMKGGKIEAFNMNLKYTPLSEDFDENGNVIKVRFTFR